MTIQKARAPRKPFKRLAKDDPNRTFSRSCIHPGCGVSAAYGETPGSYWYCKTHALPHMRNQRNPRCQGKKPDGSDCIKQRSFGLAEDGIAKFCADHKAEGMINVNVRRCQHDGCTDPARYAVAGAKATWCHQHREPGAVDVYARRCTTEGCNTEPVYGWEGQRAEACARHAREGMVNVKARRCQHPGCHTQPSFAPTPTQSAVFCAKHKTAGFVDVVSRLCEKQGCSTNATFGFEDDIHRWCKKHGEPRGAVDVKNQRCEFLGCHTQPSFGASRHEPARFCVKHKEPTMVDVRSIRCHGCQQQRAKFGTTSGAATHCYQCKSPNMSVSHPMFCEFHSCIGKAMFGFEHGSPQLCSQHKLTGMVDLVNSVCDVCDRYAPYGFPGQGRSRCSQHRQPGMLQRPNGVCVTCPRAIRTPATHGVRFALHCADHAEEEERNLTERPCVSCNLTFVLDETGHCELCHPRVAERAVLVKQRQLFAFLNSEGFLGTQTDRQVAGGVCGKERPDRVYETLDRIIVVECDEHQHRERPPTCEHARMVNVSQAFGGRPVLWIRYNPDAYRPVSTEEALYGRPHRMQTLLRVLKHALDSGDRPAAFVQVLYLYYDGWQEGVGETRWQPVMPWES